MDLTRSLSGPIGRFRRLCDVRYFILEEFPDSPRRALHPIGTLAVDCAYGSYHLFWQGQPLFDPQEAELCQMEPADVFAVARQGLGHAMRRLLSQPWTTEQLETLTTMVAGDEAVRSIARKLHRSPSGIRGNMAQLGIHPSAKAGNGPFSMVTGTF